MDLSLGPEHLGLLLFIMVVLEFLKKRGLNDDYAPFVALALGWLGALPLIIWQERMMLAWPVILAGMFVEGSAVACFAMGGYDLAVKKGGLRRLLP